MTDTQRVFEDIPFQDREKATKAFSRLEESAYPGKCKDQVHQSIIEHLYSSVDPDMAINNLERFLESSYNRMTSYDFFNQVPVALEMVIKLCGESQFLSDVLVRNPDYLDWLVEEGQLNTPKSLQEYRQETEQLILSRKTLDMKMNTARRYHRRELLRIGVRDILRLGDILELAEELSCLASALIDIAVKSCSASLEKKYGVPCHYDFQDKKEKSRFAVIGMGKLGGEELNFSSDIDLLFVYQEEGETSKGTSNFEYFSRLSEEVIRFLSYSTDQGSIYRVDMRLRPEGKAGPLARSLDSYEQYYEGFAETWERVALIKARCIGGDMDIGRQFEQTILPFVFRRYLDFRGIEEMRGLKTRMQKEFADKWKDGYEIKSGTGGIREIEFYVSILQLLYGGKNPSLRIRQTAKILNELIQLYLIKKDDGDFLLKAYRFLRQVEEKLQLMHQLQTHHLSGDESFLEKLSRQLGYQDRTEFLNILQETTTGVHEIFLSLFMEETVHNLRDKESLIKTILDPATEKEEAGNQLSNLGFQDPEQSLHLLRQLGYGSQERIVAPEVRRRLENLLGEMLSFLNQLPNPDLGVRQFTRFINRYGSPKSLYTWLTENPETFQRLMMIFSSGESLGEMLIKEPGRLEGLVFETNPTHLLSVFNTCPENPDLIPSSWEEKKFVFAILELFREVEYPVLTKLLTKAAREAITLLIDRVLLEPRLKESFSIIAMGRLGNGELSFGSDLDILFVYADEETDSYSLDLKDITPLDFQNGSELVELIIKELSSKIAEVDIRLRPEGDKGALIMAPGDFARYFQKRASFWERLAWTRATHLYGNPRLSQAVLDAAHPFIHQSASAAETAAQTYLMRMKMQNAITPDKDSYRNIKSGYGGLVDIEFITQYFALLDSSEQTTGKTTIELLQYLKDTGIISKEDTLILSANYLYLSGLQNRLKYANPYANNLIPDTDPELNILSKMMKYTQPKELLSEYQLRTQQNRNLLDKYLKKE